MKLKKKIAVYLQINLVPILLSIYARFVFFTAKKTYHFPKNYNNEPMIYAFWHGNNFLHPFAYRKLKKNGNIKTIISEHRDGVMIKNYVNLLGIGNIEGSSTRGGVKALLNAIKEIKNGNDVAITPDGPKGPMHSVADGIVVIAQKTNCPILVGNYVPEKYYKFEKSWDNFILPKPFSKIDFYISEPIYINDLSFDDAKELIQKNILIHELI